LSLTLELGKRGRFAEVSASISDLSQRTRFSILNQTGMLLTIYAVIDTMPLTVYSLQ
jgi:hypothetical protein